MLYSGIQCEFLSDDDYGNQIRILAHNAKAIFCAVAWTTLMPPKNSSTGVTQHDEKSFPWDKVQAAAIGLDRNITTPIIIDKYRSNSKFTFVRCPSGIFHPKLFLFDFDDETSVIIAGSANLTESGTRSPLEVGIKITCQPELSGKHLRDQVERQIHDWASRYRTNTHGYFQTLLPHGDRKARPKDAGTQDVFHGMGKWIEYVVDKLAITRDCIIDGRRTDKHLRPPETLKRFTAISDGSLSNEVQNGLRFAYVLIRMRFHRRFLYVRRLLSEVGIVHLNPSTIALLVSEDPSIAREVAEAIYNNSDHENWQVDPGTSELMPPRDFMFLAKDQGYIDLSPCQEQTTQWYSLLDQVQTQSEQQTVFQICYAQSMLVMCKEVNDGIEASRGVFNSIRDTVTQACSTIAAAVDAGGAKLTNAHEQASHQHLVQAKELATHLEGLVTRSIQSLATTVKTTTDQMTENARVFMDTDTLERVQQVPNRLASIDKEITKLVATADGIAKELNTSNRDTKSMIEQAVNAKMRINTSVAINKPMTTRAGDIHSTSQRNSLVSQLQSVNDAQHLWRNSVNLSTCNLCLVFSNESPTDLSSTLPTSTRPTRVYEELPLNCRDLKQDLFGKKYEGFYVIVFSQTMQIPIVELLAGLHKNVIYLIPRDKYKLDDLQKLPHLHEVESKDANIKIYVTHRVSPRGN